MKRPMLPGWVAVEGMSQILLGAFLLSVVRFRNEGGRARWKLNIVHRGQGLNAPGPFADEARAQKAAMDFLVTLRDDLLEITSQRGAQ